MFKSIKTSENNRLIVRELTTKLGLGPENLIARIAFSYSIAQGEKLDTQNMEDSKGKEYSSGVLFGDKLPLYVAAICQHYGLYKTDHEVPRLIKVHIDSGLRSIYQIVKESPNLSLVDFIIDRIETGIKSL